MIIMTKSALLGEITKWAVKQSPYNNPKDLNVVLDKMNEVCVKFEDLGCLHFANQKHLDDFLYNHLLEIDEVKNWNKSKNDSNAQWIFTSAFDQPNPDDDFIDLDALIRNIVHSLIKEYEQEII